ncbi:Prolyl 3-hydroxylase 1 [Acipenser ruthenus]|uniref:Prolyl 3-hydroxylase 1 n=1 Tax=Acipenser ruthenus TaxID=7906 RepID=A0A444V3W2_ACIRT|nr:Prolyl 3-hydroxylase 1 [Acipenser ruthenus]
MESRADRDPSETAQEALRQQRHTLSSLLEERVRGAQVHSRFMELRDMDSSSKFLFSLERKKSNGKRLHCVLLPCGREFLSQEKISEVGVDFSNQLYSTEQCSSADTDMLLQGLPRLSEEEQKEGQGDFLAAAEHWEECVRETLTAINECRALCEGPYRYHGEESHLTDKRDLYQSTADHFLQVLSCRQSCVSQVATRPGRISAVEDFLPSIFEHLHFTYYKAGRIDKALESVRTFLLFYPADEPMLENLQYYLQTAGGAAGQAVTAREEISAFVNQSLGEKKLLYFGVKNLGITFNDPVSVRTSETGDRDIQALQQSLSTFQRASSADINWAKCGTFLSGIPLSCPRH